MNAGNRIQQFYQCFKGLSNSKGIINVYNGTFFDRIRETSYQLNTDFMFVPITSEITIEKGMVLKEIATNRLFEVGSRLKNESEVWADDPWELKEIESGSHKQKAVAYQELTQKYLAEVEGGGAEH
jgi:hypothetical protein